MAENDMPIFTRTFDFLTWLLPLTNHPVGARLSRAGGTIIEMDGMRGVLRQAQGKESGTCGG